MQLGDPITALAASIYSAVYKDLSEFNYETWDYDVKWDKKSPRPTKLATRRPMSYEVEVFAMFAQTWGSTALGFGGIGGASMTPAYTIIIEFRGEYCVYFAGRFAYKVTRPNNLFFEDIKNQRMKDVKNASSYSN